MSNGASRGRLAAGLLAVGSLCMMANAAESRAMTVSNAYLRAAYAPETGILSLVRAGEAAAFVDSRWPSDAVAGARSGVATLEEASPLGAGQAIEVSRADGRIDRVVLYPGLPFACFQRVIVNTGAQSTNVAAVELLDVPLSLGGSVGDLKALGTAGLTAPDGHKGSYVFLAIADPATRRGAVGAWLSQDRGSGIVFSTVDGDAVRLRARVEYGRLLVPAGGSVSSELFALGCFDDARLGLEQYADAVARYYSIHLHPQPDGYCTWYSSPHGGAADEKSIVELARTAARELKPYGFSFVQIDDHWQQGERRNGPAKVFDRVNPKGPYPGGMAPVAKAISELGLTPGIWWMPFAGDYRDPFFADKQEWFAHSADGKPYFARWGGTSLDMTNPKARDYVTYLARRLSREWGYTYFKMDGLWVGTATKLLYVNNEYKPDDLGEPVVHDPSMTPIEAFRRGFKCVREGAGPDVFFLGCCVSQNMRSFGASFGLVDAMRIGPDNGCSWGGLKRGPWHGSNRYFLQGRVWYNDPDPVYVRTSLPLEQSRLICSWVAVSGQFNVSSEWLDGLPPERLDILKRTLPNHGRCARPVDLFDRELPRIWVVHDKDGDVERTVVGLFNWEDEAAVGIDCPLERLGLDPSAEYVGFDYWGNSFVAPFSKALVAELPAATCRVLSLRKAGSAPRVVSTSRHITQGLVELSGESWSAGKGELTGRSRLVPGDPYELRLLVPVGEQSWTLSGVSVDGGKARVAAKTQNGPLIRIGLEGADGGEVAWRAHFAKGSVQAAKPPAVSGLEATADWSRVVLTWDAVGAQAYRVTRGDGKAVTLTGNEFVDTSYEKGRSCDYTVQAVGWDGALGASARVSVQTQALPKLGPRPPKPAVSIMSLKPVVAKTGWGKVGIGKSCQGNPLTVGGTVYRDGVGVHANGLTVYDIPAGATRFVAVAGLDDEQKHDPRASVVFEVYGDVKEMGEAPVLLDKSPPLCDKTLRTWHFDVALQDRFKQVRLVVTDAGDGVACDHADWVDAGFIK